MTDEAPSIKPSSQTEFDLASLNPRISSVIIRGQNFKALEFDCPLGCGFTHYVPFHAAAPIRIGDKIAVWSASGRFDDPLKLNICYELQFEPSYSSPIEKPHLHCWISYGKLRLV
jgi:hypothetical protein